MFLPNVKDSLYWWSKNSPSNWVPGGRIVSGVRRHLLASWHFRSHSADCWSFQGLPFPSCTSLHACAYERDVDHLTGDCVDLLERWVRFRLDMNGVLTYYCWLLTHRSGKTSRKGFVVIQWLHEIPEMATQRKTRPGHAFLLLRFWRQLPISGLDAFFLHRKWSIYLQVEEFEYI